MEWSKESCLNLINEYQKYPVLWNPKDTMYFSKNQKNDAWAQIGRNLNIDIEEAKKKMISLSGSFRREKAKTRNSFGTGKGRKDIYASKWFAFESMKFMMDRDDPRPTINTSNENISDDSRSDSFNMTENEAEYVSILSNSLSNDDISEKATNPNNVLETSTSNVSKPAVKRPRKKFDPCDDSRLEEAFSILKQSASSQQPQPLKGSAIFGQHVAGKLDTYTSRTRAFVEHSINNILFEVDIGRFENYFQHINQPAHYQNQGTQNFNQPAHYQNQGTQNFNQPAHYQNQDTQHSFSTVDSPHSLITNPDSPYNLSDLSNQSTLVPSLNIPTTATTTSASLPLLASVQTDDVNLDLY